MVGVVDSRGDDRERRLARRIQVEKGHDVCGCTNVGTNVGMRFAEMGKRGGGSNVGAFRFARSLSLLRLAGTRCRNSNHFVQ